MAPITEYAISSDAGPPVERDFPEATKSPVPIEPPMAIICRCRLFSRRADVGVPLKAVDKAAGHSARGRDAVPVEVVGEASDIISEVEGSRIWGSVTVGFFCDLLLFFARHMALWDVGDPMRLESRIRCSDGEERAGEVRDRLLKRNSDTYQGTIIAWASMRRVAVSGTVEAVDDKRDRGRRSIAGAEPLDR